MEVLPAFIEFLDSYSIGLGDAGRLARWMLPASRNEALSRVDDIRAMLRDNLSEVRARRREWHSTLDAMRDLIAFCYTTRSDPDELEQRAHPDGYLPPDRRCRLCHRLTQDALAGSTRQRFSGRFDAYVRPSLVEPEALVKPGKYRRVNYCSEHSAATSTAHMAEGERRQYRGTHAKQGRYLQARRRLLDDLGAGAGDFSIAYNDAFGGDGLPLPYAGGAVETPSRLLLHTMVYCRLHPRKGRELVSEWLGQLASTYVHRRDLLQALLRPFGELAAVACERRDLLSVRIDSKAGLHLKFMGGGRDFGAPGAAEGRAHESTRTAAVAARDVLLGAFDGLAEHYRSAGFEANVDTIHLEIGYMPHEDGHFFFWAGLKPPELLTRFALMRSLSACGPRS